jgi:hypothetical protein
MAAAVPVELARFTSGSTDATPPSLAEALEVLHAAQCSIGWIAKADEELLAKPAGAPDAEENTGTRIMPAPCTPGSTSARSGGAARWPRHVARGLDAHGRERRHDDIKAIIVERKGT